MTMISVDTAMALRDAGLVWTPGQHDFFTVPVPDLRNRAFVISDITAFTERRHSQDVVAFHGVTEWALDYVLTNEAVWLPSEMQLREALEARLGNGIAPLMQLAHMNGHYQCTIQMHGEMMVFSAATAGEAYAAALLYVLAAKDE